MIEFFRDLPAHVIDHPIAYGTMFTGLVLVLVGCFWKAER